MSEYIDDKRKTIEMIYNSAFTVDSKIVEDIKNLVASGASKEEILQAFDEIFEKNLNKLFKIFANYKAEELKNLGLSMNKQKVQNYLVARFRMNIDEGLEKWNKIPHPKVISEFYKQHINEIITNKRTERTIKQMNEYLEVVGRKKIAGTIINTEEQRLNRQYERDIIAEELNTTLYLYEGPIIETSRDFCIEHVGETKPLHYWESLDNGQRLPVVDYCGGWNCQHQLMAITSEMRERYEKEGII